MTPASPDLPPTAVRVEGLAVSFGGAPVLSDIGFSVPHGSVTCFIGPSGSGKSTILRCLNALVRPDAGTVNVMGIDVDGDTDLVALRRRIGFVFQSYNLFPNLSVLRNVMLGPQLALKLDRHEAETEARALLARLRLEDKADAYPAQLSGGQQQRVAIARSLAMRPDVMLFDEVTAALDPEMVREVLDTVKEVARQGMTSIMVTHELRFARQVADEIHMLRAGKIIESGPPAKLFENPDQPETRAFLEKML